MNAEKLFKLVMAVFFAVTIIGCIDTDDDNSSSNQTDPPEIDRILLEVCYAVCTIPNPPVADSGARVYITAWFSDLDSDLRTLYINHFHESDDFTTAVQTQTAQIPEAHAPDLQYTFIDDFFTVSAATMTGHWKLRFYAVDAAGNESNEYEVDFFVRDST